MPIILKWQPRYQLTRRPRLGKDLFSDPNAVPFSLFDNSPEFYSERDARNAAAEANVIPGVFRYSFIRTFLARGSGWADPMDCI